MLQLVHDNLTPEDARWERFLEQVADMTATLDAGFRPLMTEIYEGRDSRVHEELQAHTRLTGEFLKELSQGLLRRGSRGNRCDMVTALLWLGNLLHIEEEFHQRCVRKRALEHQPVA